MKSINSFRSEVFQINDQNFDQYALDIFLFQYNNNSIYRDYVQCLNVKVEDIKEVAKIPFLPIQFFKSHKVVTGDFIPKQFFESSGTTGSTSKHYIEDLDFYNKISTKIFTSYFGELSNAIIIGLLPSYLERSNSSLVFMVNHFIEKSASDISGFYKDKLRELADKLQILNDTNSPVFLFGVTFALLELAEMYPLKIENIHIIETGGMKGRGRELIREELHLKLKSAFYTDHIYSEYGMTELLSQAYLQKDGCFHTPPWMRVMIRDIHDPFGYISKGKTGAINVIDLANVHSCAFIETEDLGVYESDGFKVLGRLDNTDVRGCNLMWS